MISDLEQHVLKTFQEFHMSPNRMLCFSGPDFEKHKGALETLASKKLLHREKFKGAYSLTDAGFATMQLCS